MGRIDHLKRNTGRGGLLKTVFGVGMVGAIAVAASVDNGTPLPALSCALGLALPALFRRVLVANVARTARLLGIGGLVIMGAAFLLGLGRGNLWPEFHPMEQVVLTVALCPLAAYLSAFFWLFSDPEVVRMD